MGNFPMVWESEEANPFSLELFWSECLSTVIGKEIKTGCTLSIPSPNTLLLKQGVPYPDHILRLFFLPLPLSSPPLIPLLLLQPSLLLPPHLFLSAMN